MRQPSLAVTVKFRAGAELDFERLDRELERCFGLISANWADAGASSAGGKFAARALALYPVLAW